MRSVEYAAFTSDAAGKSSSQSSQFSQSSQECTLREDWMHEGFGDTQSTSFAKIVIVVVALKFAMNSKQPLYLTLPSFPCSSISYYAYNSTCNHPLTTSTHHPMLLSGMKSTTTLTTTSCRLFFTRLFLNNNVSHDDWTTTEQRLNNDWTTTKQRLDNDMINWTTDFDWRDRCFTSQVMTWFFSCARLQYSISMTWIDEDSISQTFLCM